MESDAADKILHTCHHKTCFSNPMQTLELHAGFKPTRSSLPAAKRAEGELAKAWRCTTPSPANPASALHALPPTLPGRSGAIASIIELRDPEIARNGAWSGSWLQLAWLSPALVASPSRLDSIVPVCLAQCHRQHTHQLEVLELLKIVKLAGVM